MKSIKLLLLIFTATTSIVVAQKTSNTETVYKGDSLYTFVEQVPTYEGGITVFYAYIKSNLSYPIDAKNNSIEGQVFIEFIVTKKGAIEAVKVLRSIGYGCDEEALRVIKSSPDWNPGKQRGKPVNVKMVLPISFKLS